MNIRELLLVTGCSAALLTGCNSGGSTAGTTGSAGVAAAVVSGSSSVVADKVSIIDTSSSTAKLVALAIVPSFPATADYNKDQSFTYINDRATSAFKNVNEILCMISQTGYVASAAQTEATAVAYKALINKNLCKGNDSTDNASQSQQGGTSGSSAPNYATWTIKSFLNAAKQLEGHFWIFEKGQSSGQYTEPDKIITAKMIVTSTKDEVPPNGVFRLDFRAYQPTAAGQPDLTKPIFKGLMESKVNPATGLPEIRFADAEDSGKFSEAATVVKTSATSGYGKIAESESFNGASSSFAADFGFDSTYFRRSSTDGTTAKDLCFSRSSFETSTWRYGLYNSADGSRFTRNSGISFNTAADGSGMYGWAGYYGVWAPDNNAITDGMTIYSKDPATNSSLTYTLNMYKGKLKKHTKHATTLDAIKNIPFEGYNEGQNQYRVMWDGANLVKTASMASNASGPPSWVELTKPYAPLTYNNLQSGGDLNFWSQALGGQVRIPLSGCSYTPGNMGAPGTTSCTQPSGATPVTYYSEDIVYPGDATVPASLTCFDNCPKATASGMAANDMIYTDASYMPNPPSHTYTFTTTLMDGGNSAILTSAPTGQPWGFNSGPLVDATMYSAELDCSISSGTICGWKAWSLPVFYTWETGPNTWNWLTTVKNGANVVKFDPPLKVTYVHSQTDSNAFDYKYHGVSFFLDYNGFGQLNGIPGKCFDPITGLGTMDCSGNKRWVPEFTIPTGKTVSEGNNTYYVKALESEQRMKPVSSGCTATLPTTTLTLPTVSESVDPAIGSLPAGDVTYIGGVKQGAKATAKAFSRWLLGL